MHWHWHCIDCIVIVLALLGEGSIKSWSRVATLGRRGELPAELGVFFREPLQLRGRVRLVRSAFGLRIECSVFNAIIFIVIVIILLAFERRVESRRRRHGTSKGLRALLAGPGVSVFSSKPTRVLADQALPASGGEREDPPPRVPDGRAARYQRVKRLRQVASKAGASVL